MSDISKIIVGVDGSDSSRAALLWAYNEAAHHGATLNAVTSWQPPVLPTTPPYGTTPPQDYATQPEQDAMTLLEKSTAELEERTPAVEVVRSIQRGSPAKVLIELSAEADLLVVGSRGYGGFAGMLLGSVSQHLVSHASCPVVVIR